MKLKGWQYLLLGLFFVFVGAGVYISLIGQEISLSPPLPPSGLYSVDIIHDGTPKCSSFEIRYIHSPDPSVVGYRMYRNGIYHGYRTGTNYNDFDFKLSDTTYSYYVTAVDDQGTESIPSETLEYTTFPCHLTGRIIEPINVAVVLVYFSDFPNVPYDPIYAEEKVFTDQYSVKNYYEEVSYGEMSISGNVYGWYELDGASSDYCDFVTNGMGGGCYVPNSEIFDLLTQDGVNVDEIDRTLVVLNGLGQAGFGGGARVTVSSEQGFKFNTIVHELGHTFEAKHAGRWECDYNTNNIVGSDIENTLAGDCNDWRYGDSFDPMGTGQNSHINAYYKEKMGFLIPGQIGVAEDTGNYDIDVLEVQSGGIKQLRVPIIGENFYFLEYRQPIGFDSLTEEDVFGNDFFNEIDGDSSGIHIYLRSYSIWSPDDYTFTDDSETSRIDKILTLEDPVFYDPFRDIRLTLISEDGSKATVLVEYDIADTSPPSVQVINPADNEVVPISFIAEVDASDDFQVDRVDFFFNDILVYSDLAEPYETSVSVLAVPDGIYDFYASAVDISGLASYSETLNVIVEHGEGFIFPSFENDKILPDESDDDAEFGHSVAIEGDLAVVGSNLDDNEFNANGAIFIYRFDGFEWELIQELSPNEFDPTNQYGEFVDIDNDRIIVGSSKGNSETTLNSGIVHVYNKVGDVWVEEQILVSTDEQSLDEFGVSGDIGGDLIVIGAWKADSDSVIETGAAYVFRYNPGAGVWEEEQKLTPSDGVSFDKFGSAVAFEEDLIVVGAIYNDEGANDAGAAYVFRYNSGSGLWEEEQKLENNVPGFGDWMGGAVDIENGEIFVGESKGEIIQNNIGIVNIYNFDGSNWIESQEIEASDGNVNDLFGHSVSASGNLLVVGVNYRDDMGIDSGAAYVYEKEGNEWILFKKLLALDGVAEDEFGFSVATDGEKAIIGSRFDDPFDLNSGSAYVFNGLGLDDAGAPESPILISPSDENVYPENYPLLDWSDVVDESGVVYHLQVSDDFDFNDLLINEFGFAISEYAVDLSLDIGTYFWRVRAKDGFDNVGEWSEVWSFTVAEPPVCGDGLAEYWEECDDGNVEDGDGCTSTCELEAICGDGLAEFFELCDDGNTENGDGCSSECTIEAVCGNAVIEEFELCDDGNTNDDDQCRNQCQTILFDTSGDGVVTIVGDLPPFLSCMFFNNCQCADVGLEGQACYYSADSNGDGLLTIVNDLEPFIDCLFFGDGDACSGNSIVSGDESSVGGVMLADDNPVTASVGDLVTLFSLSQGGPVQSVVTDQNGLWRFFDVEEGPYRATIYCGEPNLYGRSKEQPIVQHKFNFEVDYENPEGHQDFVHLRSSECSGGDIFVWAEEEPQLGLE
jgi:cysteine-rich repeat protein